MTRELTCRETLRALGLGVLVALWALAVPARGADIAVGTPLPAVSIDDKGELLIDGDKVRFQPWSTDSLLGKPVYLQYVAARQSASELNQPFSDAVAAAAIPPGQIHVAAVINVADALWGTGGLVAGELKKNKAEHPHSMIVHDADGRGRAAWGLAEKSSAVIILDATGTVLFARDGALSADDIVQALTLLRSAIVP